MTFTVLVHEAEEGGYWAEVPELPGCVSQGETLDELERNIDEAIQAVIAVRIEDGETFPAVRKWEISVSA
jgi:predicted RNase H-like HicB family nuclease